MNLSKNNIETVPQKLKNLKLIELDLSYNNIKVFPDLNKFKYLKILNLSNNNLDEIINKDKNDMLLDLNISFNLIRYLDTLNNL